MRPFPHPSSRVLLSGFCAVDRVVPFDGAAFEAAGGSCVNVALNLRRLNVGCRVAATVGDDREGRLLRGALEAADVETSLLRLDPNRATATALQRNAQPGARPDHAFFLRDPDTGVPYPRHIPLDPSLALDAMTALDADGAAGAPRAFWFDQTSPAVLGLARHARKSGALVFFEPTQEDDPLLEPAARLAHVVKHSEADLEPPETPAPLRIATDGGNGLHCSFSGGPWRRIRAARVERVVDSAGAGDAFTAGFLAELLFLSGVADTPVARLLADEGAARSAINVGMDLGLQACGHAGAGGWRAARTQNA